MIEQFFYTMIVASVDQSDQSDIERCVLQWNPVNAGTKGPCQSVHIIQVFILSGLSDVKSNPCDNVIFKATKCLNCTLAEILTALNHCLVSSAIVTLTATSLTYGTVHTSTHSVHSD